MTRSSAATARHARASLAPVALLLALASAAAGPAPSGAAPAPLRTEGGTFLGVLDSLHSSILTIVAVPDPDARSGPRRKRLIGTGVAASERDFITTASVAFPRGSVRVLLGGGIERTAALRGVDRQSNLAVFRIEEPVLQSLRRAPPQSLAVGAWVAVISNVTITRPQASLGRVVGRGERVDFPYSGDVLEIEAPSYPGTAGGAVLNEDGEWVALVVGRGMPRPDGSRVGGPGHDAPSPHDVLLAVPVDQVDRIAADLIEHGAVRRGFLGIRLKRAAAGAPAPGESLGVSVDGVIPGSPAAAGGIRRGDRVLAFEGQEIRDPEDLILLVAAMRPGEGAELTILRETEILPIHVTLGANVQGSAAAAAPEDARAAAIRRLREDVSRLQSQAREAEEKLRALERGAGGDLGEPERSDSSAAPRSPGSSTTP